MVTTWLVKWFSGSLPGFLTMVRVCVCMRSESVCTKAWGRAVMCLKPCMLISEQERQEVFEPVCWPASCRVHQSHCLSLSVLASLSQWPSCSTQVWLSEGCTHCHYRDPCSRQLEPQPDRRDRRQTAGYFSRSQSLVVCFASQVPLKQ